MIKMNEVFIQLQTRFEELLAIVTKENCTNRDELLSEMRENIQERSEIVGYTSIRDVDANSLEQLIYFHGSLKEHVNKKSREAINNSARKVQVSKNKFSRENPYPPKK